MSLLTPQLLENEAPSRERTRPSSSLQVELLRAKFYAHIPVCSVFLMFSFSRVLARNFVSTLLACEQEINRGKGFHPSAKPTRRFAKNTCFGFLNTAVRFEDQQTNQYLSTNRTKCTCHAERSRLVERPGFAEFFQFCERSALGRWWVCEFANSG